MNNQCEWCAKTSDQIDSLEYEVEELKNYQLHAQDDLTAKDKELAESIPISAIEKTLNDWQINIDCADHYVIGAIWKSCKREIDNLIKEAKG